MCSTPHNYAHDLGDNYTALFRRQIPVTIGQTPRGNYQRRLPQGYSSGAQKGKTTLWLVGPKNRYHAVMRRGRMDSKLALDYVHDFVLQLFLGNQGSHAYKSMDPLATASSQFSPPLPISGSPEHLERLELPVDIYTS
jgi:hypothetical protein